jgi:hypothetical protein
MNTIHKQLLIIDGTQSISVKGYMKSLKVAQQKGNLYLWFLRDLNDISVTRLDINIYGTGHEVKIHSDHYFDTVMNNGFVWHVFIK